MHHDQTGRTSTRSRWSAAGAFKLVSIYQAFVQGRGSDYSYVIYHRPDVKNDDQYDRMVWAAESVGVGLIGYVKPGASTTWMDVLPARRRSASAEERRAFERLALTRSTSADSSVFPKVKTTVTTVSVRRRKR